jgi:hypothetical protein
VDSAGTRRGPDHGPVQDLRRASAPRTSPATTRRDHTAGRITSAPSPGSSREAISSSHCGSSGPIGGESRQHRLVPVAGLDRVEQVPTRPARSSSAAPRPGAAPAPPPRGSGRAPARSRARARSERRPACGDVHQSVAVGGGGVVGSSPRERRSPHSASGTAAEPRCAGLRHLVGVLHARPPSTRPPGGRGRTQAPTCGSVTPWTAHTSAIRCARARTAAGAGA